MCLVLGLEVVSKTDIVTHSRSSQTREKRGLKLVNKQTKLSIMVSA